MADPVPEGLAYYGEFAHIAPLLVLRGRLMESAYEPAAILLPLDLFAGATEVWGLRVIRVEGVEPGLVYGPRRTDNICT